VLSRWSAEGMIVVLDHVHYVIDGRD